MEAFMWFVEAAATFIESYLLLEVTGILLHEEMTVDRRWKQAGITLVEFLGTMLCNRVQLVSVLPLLVMAAIMLSLQKIILKRRLFWCTIIFGFYMVAVTMIDYLVVYSAAKLLKLHFEALVSDVGYRRVFCIVFSKGILILIVELVRYLSLDVTKVHTKRNVFILLTIAAFCSAPVVMLLNYSSLYELGGVFVWILLIFLLAVVLLIKYIVNNEKKYQQELSLEIENTKNKMLEDTLLDLEESFSMWRSSVHDYKHTILYMQHLLDDNRVDELKQYLSGENEKLLHAAHYYKTGNSMLDVVINTKYRIMKQKNIIFMNDISLLQEIPINELDLGILLGNLLDNAIEASVQSEESYISLVIQCKNHLMELELTNSYDKKRMQDFQTTKKEKRFHGIGLKSVEKIVERYDGKMERIVHEEEVIVKIAFTC